jgi:hypothetical protein
MPKSRQRKNHKQKSLVRTKKVKVEQAKFQKEYQAKMMEELEKLREKFENEKEKEVTDRISETEVVNEFAVLDETNSLNEIKIDYNPPASSPF